MFISNMKKTAQHISWEIRGPSWTYPIQAEQEADPVELVTTALEAIVGNEQFSDNDMFPQTGGELDLGLFLVAVHENMSSPDEHILVPVPMILANAGFYSEGARLEKTAAGMDTADLLRHLLEEVEGRSQPVRTLDGGY